MNNSRAPNQISQADLVEQDIYLLQESRVHLQDISAKLQNLAQEVATSLAAKACCIYGLDQKRQQRIPYAQWSTPRTTTNFIKQAVGEGVVGLVAQTEYQQAASPNKNSNRNLVRVDDLKNDSRFKSIELDFPHQSILAAPLITSISDQMSGMVLVADKRDLSTFSRQDEQTLSTFANRTDLILAIQNLELYQEKQRRDQELTIISQLNQALAASPNLVDLESTCHSILGMTYLKELFQYDIAEICLLDEQTQKLASVVRLPEDNDGEEYPHTYRLEEGYTGWIAANHQSLLISDTHTQADIVPAGDLHHFPYRSYIGVPLMAGQNFLGTLELAAIPAHFYDRRDLAILEVVANQAVIAIDYARRFSLTDQQLQRRVDELGGLQRVSHELNSTLDLDRILSLVLEEAMRVTEADFGNVSLYKAQTAELTAHKEQSNNGQSTQGEYEVVPIQQSIMGRALQTGQAVLIPNILEDPDFVDRGRNTCSQVVVPIYYGGEPAGVINLESQHLNFFTNDQLRSLEALANHAAVAIGNAQAFQAQKTERERASRRADQLVRLAEISNAFRTNRPLHEVLEDIAYAIMESVGFNVVIISLVEGTPPIIRHEVGAGVPIAQFEAVQASGFKPPLSNLEEIMLEDFCLGNAYFIPAEQMEIWQDKLNVPYVEKHQRPDFDSSDTEDETTRKEEAWQVGDLLFVPLTDTEEKIIGLITVENPDTDCRPDGSTVQTLEIFANHAAAAIENAHLFELEQQRRRLADTLRGLAETISSQLEFDELLNIVLQELKKVVDYDSANVQLLKEDKLVIIGGHGWQAPEQVLGLAFSMEGSNPNRKVIETQEPVIVKDAQTEYPASFSKPPHDVIKSWLGVPLTYGTNVLGLMGLDNAQPNFFSQEDADVVSAFANQVSVALQNAQLFEEARQQVRQLAALTEVAQSINRALDLDEVLNLVLDAVFDLVGDSEGSIWLIDDSTNTVRIANTKNLPDFLVEALNESNISVDTEPFATVIQSSQVSVIAGSSDGQNEQTSYGLPAFPDDVTYVPLKTEDSVIGMLAIESVIHQKNMLELVTTLADLAAVAIENAQLVQRLNQFTEQLEQRVEERTKQLAETLQDLTNERDRVETLYQITRELSVSLDLDRVLTEALNLINRAIGISHGSILLLDHGSGELIYRAALGRDKPLPRGGYKTQYRLGFGLAGVVMENHEPRIVPDLSQDPDWIPNKDEPDRRSAMVVPLATGEGLMGAILLFHPDVDYFMEDHLKLVTAAGAQIANAINNAELYRLITDQAERLGVMLRTEATEAAKNQAILKGIADGVLVLDAQRQVVLVNPMAAEILGIDPKLVENQSVAKILGQTEAPVQLELTQRFYDNLLEGLTKLREGQSAAEFRIDVENKAIVVTLTPVALGTAETLGVVAVLRDISKEAEIERLKNEFISTVSHELRTPLTSIKGYADLLASPNKVGDLNPIQQRFVKVIQSNANRLAELVNDILEISRIETGRIRLRFETLDIIQLIREVALSFEGQLVQKTMDLSLRLPEELPQIYADKARLTQILVNLIGNAWQYTAEGGKIEVSAQILDDRFAQVKVTDTGIGIPEEDLEHIFERFFRSERHEVQLVDGTGLGLSITKSFVELLGGTIQVDSELNVGTSFSFTVPLASHSQQEKNED